MQGETLLACYSGGTMTAQRAAEDFAATFWDKPRPITGWDGAYFQMKDTSHWYRVHLPMTGSGWEISRTDKPV